MTDVLHRGVTNVPHEEDLFLPGSRCVSDISSVNITFLRGLLYPPPKHRPSQKRAMVWWKLIFQTLIFLGGSMLSWRRNIIMNCHNLCYCFENLWWDVVWYVSSSSSMKSKVTKIWKTHSFPLLYIYPLVI